MLLRLGPLLRTGLSPPLLLVDSSHLQLSTEKSVPPEHLL